MVLLIAMCMSMLTVSAFADGHNCADYVVWNFENNGEVNPHFDAVAPTCTEDGNIEYYMCGPGPMSAAVNKMLDGLGVDPSSIHYDNFGG